MSASNAFEDLLLKHLFQNATVPNVGDATGLPASGAAGSLYVSLHTADPSEAGTQATSETAYTGYARVAVARSAAAWPVSGTAPTSVSNGSAVTFGICTASPGAAVTHFGVGTSSSGAGTLLFSGALTASYTIAVSNAPNFAIGTLKPADTD
jgi:hypothetical protein